MESSSQVLQRVYAKEKRGKYVRPFLDLHDSVLQALTEVELELGRPVMRNDVYRHMKKQGKEIDPSILRTVLNEMNRNDEILVGMEGVFYSVRPEMQDTTDN